MDTHRFDALVARAHRLLDPGGRMLLGITGAPGAGKSTLARHLVDRVEELYGAGAAVLVPMDGFHLAQAELERLGRADRKGAPDTFDAAGYTALLARLRAPRTGEVVYAPAFDRSLEEAVAGSIAVPPGVPLVVTEGNYLLHDDPAWAPVRALLDEVWFLAPDPAARVARLVERHVRYGKERSFAERWVARSDEPNARLVEAGRGRADLVVAGDLFPPAGPAGEEGQGAEGGRGPEDGRGPECGRGTADGQRAADGRGTAEGQRAADGQSGADGREAGADFGRSGPGGPGPGGPGPGGAGGPASGGAGAPDGPGPGGAGAPGPGADDPGPGGPERPPRDPVCGPGGERNSGVSQDWA